MKNTTVLFINKAFVIIGIILISTAFYGSIFSINTPNKKSYSKLGLNKQKQIEQFSPELWYQVKSLDDLHELANNQNFNLLTSQEKMDVIFNLVIQNFIHKEAKHTFLSNYILFFLGQIHDSFLHIHNPDILLSKVYYGFCDQQSYVLLKLASKFGLHGRHVGLNGHVVVEIFYDNEFHLYDPDLEVIPKNKNGKVLSIAELIQDDVLLNKYYDSDAIQIIKNINDHNYVTTPAGSWFVWKANVLYKFEELMEYFKFIFPILLIIIGVYLKKALLTNKRE